MAPTDPLPPQNCPFPWGPWYPSNTWFLVPTQVIIPNGISISSAIFAQLTVECPYTLEWAATFLQKISLPLGDRGPIQHMVPRAHPSHQQNGISIGSAFLQGSRTWQQTNTDWPTMLSLLCGLIIIMCPKYFGKRPNETLSQHLAVVVVYRLKTYRMSAIQCGRLHLFSKILFFKNFALLPSYKHLCCLTNSVKCITFSSVHSIMFFNVCKHWLIDQSQCSISKSFFRKIEHVLYCKNDFWKW